MSMQDWTLAKNQKDNFFRGLKSERVVPYFIIQPFTDHIAFSKSEFTVVASLAFNVLPLLSLYPREFISNPVFS